MFVGVRLQRNRLLIYAALGTLGLAVTKLFLVDLSAVDTIWRILLFLGCGGLFLVLSYYFQNLLRPAPGGTSAAAEGEDGVDSEASAEDEILPEPGLIPAGEAPPPA